MTQSQDHERAIGLLPWLVNETLTGEERSWLEQHVRDCVLCRAALKEQRALATLVGQQDTVHLSAEAGFRELMHRIETPPATRASRIGYWPLAAAAALAIVALTGILTFITPQDEAARFSTLSQDEDAAAQALLIDVIFANGIGEAAMRDMLQEMDATIVAGPSSMGRYTIRIDATEPADALIDALNEDERVRFAGPSFETRDGP